MDLRDKIVNFENCKRCKYWLLPENEEPCDECLDNPVNEYSHLPINFKEEKTVED